MEQKKQQQLEDLIVKAFTQIGDDLGDLLYDEEVMLINDSLHQSANIEKHNTCLAKELDLTLAESYEQLLAKIILCLKDRFKISN